MELPRITRGAVTSTRSPIYDEASRAQAAAFDSLAQSARVIGETIRQREVDAGSKEGAAAFAAAELDTDTGQPVNVPTRRGGILDALGVKDEAYYHAVQIAQISRAEGDAKRALLELRGEHFGSPKTFETAAQTWRRSYIQKLGDPAVIGAVDSEIEKQIETYYEDVVIERQRQDIAEARTGMDAKLTAVENDITALLREEGPDAVETAAYQALVSTRESLISQKADNPIFAYSEDERTLDDSNFSRRAEAAALLPQVRGIFETEGRAGALEAVDGVIQRLDLSPSEAVTLRSSLVNEINQMQEVESARIAEVERAEARRKKILDADSDRLQRDLIDKMNDPALSTNERVEAVRAIRDHLSPSEYESYMKKALGESDSGLPVSQFVSYRQLAKDGELTVADIADLPVTQTQANTLIADVERREKIVSKAGRDILKASFSNNGFYPDPEISKLEAAAEADFDRWFDQHEESATPEQARTQAAEIAKTYGRQMISINPYLTTETPTPEDFSAAEDAILDDPDMNETERAAAMREIARIRSMIGN